MFSTIIPLVSKKLGGSKCKDLRKEEIYILRKNFLLAFEEFELFLACISLGGYRARTFQIQQVKL